jgi:superfamily I DNA/RNA helicase
VDNLLANTGSVRDYIGALGALEDRTSRTRLDAARSWAKNSPGGDAMWKESWNYLYSFAESFEGSIDDFLAVVEEAVAAAEFGKQIAKDRNSAPEQRQILKPGDPEPDYVVLTTAHSSKGREWRVVFTLGWVDTLWPLKRALDNRGDEGEAEERRLAYVAITRAKDTAYLSRYEKDRQRGGRSLEVPASRYLKIFDGKTFELPAPSSRTGEYQEWVNNGCPDGQAPIVVRDVEN